MLVVGMSHSGALKYTGSFPVKQAVISREVVKKLQKLKKMWTNWAV